MICMEEEGVKVNASVEVKNLKLHTLLCKTPLLPPMSKCIIYSYI